MKGLGWKRQRGPCGQECLSGAQEVLSRPAELVGKVRGKQDVEPRDRRGGEKEEGTEPGGGKKHPVMSKKNRKSFKGLNQEGQHLLGWTHGREEGKGSSGDQERGTCVVFRSCGGSEDVERRMKTRNI